MIGNGKRVLSSWSGWTGAFTEFQKAKEEMGNLAVGNLQHTFIK